MKVTAEPKKFSSITIELQTEDEVRKLMNLMDPGTTTTLQDFCAKYHLNASELCGFKNKIWDTLDKMIDYNIHKEVER